MIEVINLTRTFGSKKAVNQISFNVNKGDILGFLGPNGAGKSTTMRMLTGYVAPTSGKALIDGFDIEKQPLKVKSKLGYLSETSPLYTEMTVEEFLSFCADIRGFSGKAKNMKIDSAIEKCFLSKARKQQINTLSKGYRQRVSFAQSILHDPRYLILDEPTDGLDPNQKHEVRQMIKSMSQDKAIILSTHILEEAAAICNRSIIISNGEIITDTTPVGLCEKDPDFGSISMEIGLKDSDKDLTTIIEKIKEDGIVENINEIKENNRVKLKIRKNNDSNVNSSELIGKLEKTITSMSGEIISLSINQGDITKVFRMLTSAN